MTDVEALTKERGKTHGDWVEQVTVAHMLKRDMRAASGYFAMHPHKQEALDMIAVKISRILTGDAGEPDHWDDIQGYAHLGKAGHSK